MRKYLIAVFLILTAFKVVAQIKTDYHEGMVIPDKVDLTVLSPNKGENLRIEKPFPSGFYTLIANLNNYREQIQYIRLMNLEVKELFRHVWGKGTLAQKKAYMRQFLLSSGCNIENNGYLYYGGKRWCDNSSEEYNDINYIYPYEYDNILTKDDINDKYFGCVYNMGGDITDLLPNNSGLTYCGFQYDYQGDAIIIQNIYNYADQYYVKRISREQIRQINYKIYGHYPRKVKENLLVSMLISYGVRNVGTSSSDWKLYEIEKEEKVYMSDLGLRIGSAKMINTTPVNTNKQQQLSVKNLFYDFIRSIVFTKEERNWYNQHFTRDQLDAMTGAGIGIATGGGSGQYSCRSCTASFSNQADLRAHENAYHDY